MTKMGSAVKTGPPQPICDPVDSGTIGQQSPGQIQVTFIAGLQEDILDGEVW